MLSSRIYIGWPSSIALRVYSRREIFVAYCPRQAPMGACSSNAKKWGWAVTRRRYLNCPIIPAQVPTQEVKLAARGYYINLHHWFALNCFVGPAWQWKTRVVLESGPTCGLIARLPQRSLLAVCEFCAASEECYRQVFAKLWCRMLLCLKRIRTITAMYVNSVNLLSIHYGTL